MADDLTPRQRLGSELQGIRKLAGKSQVDLVSAGDGLPNQVAVSRIESGRRAPTMKQAQAWLRLADGAARTRAVDLLDDAVRTVRSWREVYGDRKTLQGKADEEIRASREVRAFQTALVPGLLQSGDMARELFVQLAVDGPEVRAAERIARQAVLYESGRQFRFLLMERVLSCVHAPHLQRVQLQHIATLAALESVELGIVPEPADMGEMPFTLFTPMDGEGVYVRSESRDVEREETGPAEVAQFERKWARLHAAATVGDDAIALIRSRM